jgi:hypothetical protein
MRTETGKSNKSYPQVWALPAVPPRLGPGPDMSPLDSGRFDRPDVLEGPPNKPLSVSMSSDSIISPR